MLELCWNRSQDTAHLAHLQLEQPPLLLHLLCNLSTAELSANHPVLPGMLPLLLLSLRSAEITHELEYVFYTARRTLTLKTNKVID